MNVLVVEINKYHNEVLPLYPEYIPALINEDANILFAVNPYSFDSVREQLTNVIRLTSKFFYKFIYHFQLRRLYFLYKINALVRKHNIDMVVFNTIEPKRIYWIFKHIRAKHKIAIVHNYNQVALEKKQDEHYFVLSDYAYKNLKDKHDIIDGYLLPYFASIEFSHEHTPSNELVIAVSGHIDFSKRDYPHLIEVCLGLRRRSIKNIKFNIISSCSGPGEARKFEQLVSQHALTDYFIFHEHLTDYCFFKNVYDSDIVMPLLNLTSNHRFTSTKITAAYSMACIYSKPVLVPKVIADSWDIDKDTAFIYTDTDNAVELLSRLNTAQITAASDATRRNVERRIAHNKALLANIIL